MKLFNETPFDVRSLQSAFEPGSPFVSVIIKGTFDLVPGGVCAPLPKKKQQKIGPPEQFSDAYGNSLKTDGDLIPYKPKADCIFVGSAYTPQGRSVEGIEVAFGVGQSFKRLAVWGDRNWVREAGGGVRVEGPAPFTSMPIRNELAHGGPKSKYNPHGIGFGELPEEAGARLQIANILPVNEGVAPWDRDEEPAGFGALGPAFLPRRPLAGTYDEHWLWRRRPLPPRDFDPAYFNGARRDQQIDGFLRGDEEIYLEHLQPGQDVVRTSLPGVKVRCFVQRHTSSEPDDRHDEFAEVLTNLDTCIVDGDEGLVTLVWRGTLAIASPKSDQIHFMLVATEPVNDPQPREFYLQNMVAEIEKRRPKPPSGEVSDETKKKIAAMHEKGIQDVVKTLRSAKADEALIAEVERQTTVDDALKVMTEYVEAIRKTLPPLPEE